MSTCLHITAAMDMDMTQWIWRLLLTWIWIMAPCPHITAQSRYGSMYAYYCSHGYGYDSMSAYLSI